LDARGVPSPSRSTCARLLSRWSKSMLLGLPFKVKLLSRFSLVNSCVSLGIRILWGIFRQNLGKMSCSISSENSALTFVCPTIFCASCGKSLAGSSLCCCKAVSKATISFPACARMFCTAGAIFWGSVVELTHTGSSRTVSGSSKISCGSSAGTGGVTIKVVC